MSTNTHSTVPAAGRFAHVLKPGMTLNERFAAINAEHLRQRSAAVTAPAVAVRTPVAALDSAPAFARGPAPAAVYAEYARLQAESPREAARFFHEHHAALRLHHDNLMEAASNSPTRLRLPAAQAAPGLPATCTTPAAATAEYVRLQASSPALAQSFLREHKSLIRRHVHALQGAACALVFALASFVFAGNAEASVGLAAAAAPLPPLPVPAAPGQPVLAIVQRREEEAADTLTVLLGGRENELVSADELAALRAAEAQMRVLNLQCEAVGWDAVKVRKKEVRSAYQGSPDAAGFAQIVNDPFLSTPDLQEQFLAVRRQVKEARKSLALAIEPTVRRVRVRAAGLVREELLELRRIEAAHAEKYAVEYDPSGTVRALAVIADTLSARCEITGGMCPSELLRGVLCLDTAELVPFSQTSASLSGAGAEVLSALAGLFGVKIAPDDAPATRLGKIEAAVKARRERLLA